MSARQTGFLVGLLALSGVGLSACNGPDVVYEAGAACKGYYSAVVHELRSPASENTIHWTPDGSQILFDFSEGFLHYPWPLDVPDIFAAHVSGDPVYEVLNLPSRNLEHGHRFTMTMFSLSADGSRFAYTACALTDESVQGDEGVRRVYNSEIFVSNFDGSNVERLTNNTYLDALPAWSPDGESLAFISDPDRSVGSGVGGSYTQMGPIGFEATTRITVHELATGESREIGLPEGYAAAPIRLEWSPSGGRIAFVVLEGEKSPWDLAVYTVDADGTGLTRVSDAKSGPTWSPDGQAIALVVPEEDREESLLIFGADGSNCVKERYRLDTSKLNGNYGTSIGTEGWMGNLSWSPDGSGILFERFRLEGRPAVANPRTGTFKAAVPGSTHAQNLTPFAAAGAGLILASPLTDTYARFTNSAWSPDGTQVAIRHDIADYFELYVVDLQGNKTKIVDWKRNFRSRW